VILRLPPAVSYDGLNSPDLAALSEQILGAVRRLKGISLDTSVEILLARSASGTIGSDLIDELGAYVCPSNRRDPDLIRRKVAEEAGWAAGLVPRIERWAAGEITLLNLLAEAAVLVFGAPRPFRRCAAGIVPDNQGRQVVFPSPEQSAAMIRKVDIAGRTLLLRRPALAAILVSVTLVHAHPFEDGNGRLSRALFAAVMRAGSGSSVDIPVLALECLSYPSYLVRVRRAQCLGHWAPITAHILAALEVIPCNVAPRG